MTQVKAAYTHSVEGLDTDESSDHQLDDDRPITHEVSAYEFESESEASSENEKASDKASKLLAGVTTFVESTVGSKKRKRADLIFSTDSHGKRTSARKLEVGDLQSSVINTSIKRSLHVLSKPDISSSNATRHRPKLTAPISKVQQDSLDRQAAYGKTKESLDQWLDTVKQMREAPRLSFPLRSRSSQLASTRNISLSLSDSLDHAQNETNWEGEITRCLANSRTLSRNQIQSTEDLIPRQINGKENQQRIAHLRLSRELLYREELRAKRIKKIKSKSYRRLMKREREKLQKHMIPTDLETEKNLEVDEMDRLRAEERMSHRHKQSRWAKDMRNSGRSKWSDDVRNDIHDLARRNEELQNRVFSRNDSESETTDQESRDSLTETMTPNADLNVTRHNIGLLSMKFMEEGEKRRDRGEILESDEDSASTDERSDAGLVTVGLGRKFFHDSLDKKSLKRQFLGPETKISINTMLPFKDQETVHLSETVGDKSSIHADSYTVKKTQSNPWISTHLPEKHRDDPRLETSQLNNSVMHASGTQVISKVSVVATKSAPTKSVSVRVSNQQVSSEPADQPSFLGNVGEPYIKHSPQSELIQRAFAGDDVINNDVVQDEEESTMKTDIVSSQIPGWGNWISSNDMGKEPRSKSSKARVKNRRTHCLPIDEHNQQGRRSQLAEVIQSSKQAKKTSKYLATNLPFPYESREQYERSLRFPLGEEWASKNIHRNMVTPRVLVKSGNVIEPLDSRN